MIFINREATSDRISLGITTCLTMTFLGLEVRTDLPQVSYPTAIDYYVFVSFMFIFFAVVQVNMILMIYHDDISNETSLNSVIILCLNFFATFI